MRNLLFDEKSSDSTILSWPLNVFRCSETPFSHISTVPSSSAEIILLPFLSYPVLLIKGPDSVIWCSRVPFARLHVSSLPPAVPTTISSSFGLMLIVETASSKFILERCFLTFQSQIITFPSSDPETNKSPRGLNSRSLIEFLWPERVVISFISGILRNCKLPSSPPMARILPFGWKARLFMLLLPITLVDFSNSCSFMFHRITVPSRLPEAKISPPVLRASTETALRWPRITACAVLWSVLQILTVSSWPPVTANFPPAWRTSEMALCSWLEITLSLFPFWILNISREELPDKMTACWSFGEKTADWTGFFPSFKLCERK